MSFIVNVIFFLGTFLHLSFADRGSRKAHPKAAKLGGSKKVEGFKSNLKDRKPNKEKEAWHASSEELSLFARLDELEEKEAQNAELDQLWQDDSDNRGSKTAEIEFEKRDDDTRSTPLQSENTNQTKKKVAWETLDSKNDAVVDSNDSSGSENCDDEDVQRTISVRFSSSSTSLQGQVNNTLKY